MMVMPLVSSRDPHFQTHGNNGDDLYSDVARVDKMFYFKMELNPLVIE